MTGREAVALMLGFFGAAGWLSWREWRFWNHPKPKASWYRPKRRKDGR